MKVAIVSLFGNFNYGNRLQSYAVQQVLKKMGFDSKVIYVQPVKEVLFQKLRAIYFNTPLHELRHATEKQVRYYKKQKKFEEFNLNNIHLQRYSSVKEISGYEYYVLGSDQVWNPKRYDETKKQLFFLTFTNSDRKVCFSPSFGVSELPDKWKEYFAENLKTFPLLSVRENAGAKIIKSLTGRDSEVLIDPTLMLDKNEWLQIAKKPKGIDTDKKYVLTYFLGDVPSKALIDSELISKEINGEIYNLMDEKDEALYTSGPSEFLYLFSKAQFIQTDSFHACVFAILFNKPFLLYAREGEDADMLSRIETLFNTFGLMRKYAESGLDNELFECNYDSLYERLNIERKKVYRFLERSFKNQVVSQS